MKRWGYIFILFPVLCFAQTNLFSWMTNANNEIVLTDFLVEPDSVTEYVEVPAEIEGLPVVDFGEIFCPYSNGGKQIISVYTGENVFSIPQAAFQGCEYLSSVYMSDFVTNISDFAFQYTFVLSDEISIPNVVSIGNSAFHSSGITGIDFGSFSPLESIGDGAFMYSSVESVSLPNSVEHLGVFSFAECQLLTTVTFGNSMQIIPEGVFQYSAVTSISIPPSVTSIGTSAFEYSSLQSLIFSATSSVSSIADFAFHSTLLGSVTFPASLRTVDFGAFSESMGDGKTFIFSGPVEQIVTAAFSTSGATQLIFEASVSALQESSFSDNYGLTAVIFNSDAPQSFGSGPFTASENAVITIPYWSSGWSNPWYDRSIQNWQWLPDDLIGE